MNQFVHKVKLELWSGKGGDGLISFERKRFNPKGGPSGGNGGAGGAVLLALDTGKSDLSHLARFPIQRAKNGHPGGTAQKHGKSGSDLTVQVPEHTTVFDESGEKITEITKDNPQIILLPGGKGGFGNVHFKSSRNQAPYRSQSGEAAQSILISLRLSKLADVLILGNSFFAAKQAHALLTPQEFSLERHLEQRYGQAMFSVYPGEWKQIKLMFLLTQSDDQNYIPTIRDYSEAAALTILAYEIPSDAIETEATAQLLALLENVLSHLRQETCLLCVYCVDEHTRVLGSVEQGSKSQALDPKESDGDTVGGAAMKEYLCTRLQLPEKQVYVLCPESSAERERCAATLHRQIQMHCDVKNDTW